MDARSCLDVLLCCPLLTADRICIQQHGSRLPLYLNSKRTSIGCRSFGGMAELPHNAGYGQSNPQQLQQHSAGMAGIAAAGSHGQAAASISQSHHSSPFSQCAAADLNFGSLSTAAGSSLAVAGSTLSHCKEEEDEQQQQLAASACLSLGNALAKAVKPAKGALIVCRCIAYTHYSISVITR
jgi:hypothetical protein